MKKTREEQIEKLISDYETVVKVIDKDAKENESDRSYGGIIRSAKFPNISIYLFQLGEDYSELKSKTFE